MCFLNGGRPPSGILVEVKFGCISVCETSALVSEPNFMWIPAISTDLWPLKWTFKMAAAAMLNFFFGIEISSQRTSQPACIYLHNKFGEATSTGGRVMTIYVFSKCRSAAILDLYGSKIWRYFCFWDVGFSVWAKFCVNMCNCDRVMAI